MFLRSICEKDFDYGRMLRWKDRKDGPLYHSMLQFSEFSAEIQSLEVISNSYAIMFECHDQEQLTTNLVFLISFLPYK